MRPQMLDSFIGQGVGAAGSDGGEDLCGGVGGDLGGDGDAEGIAVGGEGVFELPDQGGEGGSVEEENYAVEGGEGERRG